MSRELSSSSVCCCQVMEWIGKSLVKMLDNRFDVRSDDTVGYLDIVAGPTWNLLGMWTMLCHPATSHRDSGGGNKGFSSVSKNVVTQAQSNHLKVQHNLIPEVGRVSSKAF